MAKRSIGWFAALGLGLALAACQSAGGGAASDASAREPSPVGAVWQLQEIRYPGGDVMLPDDPAKYTLQLGADGRAAMRVDCNRATGGYTLGNSAIDFGVMAMTRAACPPGSLDSRYITALGQAVSWSLRDGRLHLEVGAGGGVLVFAQAPPSP